jgi:ATP-dependent DNA ligase
LSRFEELRRREGARTAILYAFDRKAALARLLPKTEAGILRCFAHACRLGAEGIVSKKVAGTYRSGPCPVWVTVRNPASVAVQRERSENWNR